MMRYLFVVFISVFICTPMLTQAAEKFQRSLIKEVWVKDFESSEPAACKAADVAPSHAQARQFFRRAKVLDAKTLNDNYPTAPCQVVGTLKYRAKHCEWTISAAATGSITCGKRTWLFACDDCDALLIKN